MKNYYKFQVGNHNHLLPNTFYFIFHFRLHLLKFLCTWFFLKWVPQRQNILCALIDIIEDPLALKKFSIISKCIISQIMLSVLTVSIMGLITFLPISVFQILIIIPSLSVACSLFITMGHNAIQLCIICCHAVSVLLLAISKFCGSRVSFLVA